MGVPSGPHFIISINIFHVFLNKMKLLEFIALRFTVLVMNRELTRAYNSLHCPGRGLF